MWFNGESDAEPGLHAANSSAFEGGQDLKGNVVDGVHGPQKCKACLFRPLCWKGDACPLSGDYEVHSVLQQEERQDSSGSGELAQLASEDAIIQQADPELAAEQNQEGEGQAARAVEAELLNVGSRGHPLNCQRCCWLADFCPDGQHCRSCRILRGPPQ